MKIKSVKFLKSAVKPEEFDCKKEIAFVGRSNVGKSSLINYLTNSKIAKKSSTPGYTKLINYFDINNGEFMLVDLPGYGYSKAGKSATSSWGPMIENYLKSNDRIKNLLFLLDIRIEPNDDDMKMLMFMVYYNIPFTVVATKCDKLSKVQIAVHKQKIATKLKVGVDNIYAISSEKKFGAEELLTRLDQFI